MKKATFILTFLVMLLVLPSAHAEVKTLACKSYETTHELARLYIKNILVRLLELVEEHEESGECSQIVLADKSDMVKMEEGVNDLALWVEEANIVGANFGRPPLEDQFFFVTISQPEGNVVYSLESTRFIQN